MLRMDFSLGWQVRSALLIAAAATASLSLTGCSGSDASPGTPAQSAQAAVLSGHIHGGNQPVSGATVTLYFAGATFAGGATVAATTTSANDGFGSFRFVRGLDGTTGVGNVFSCPATPPQQVAQNGGPYVFVVARGGNTVNNGTSTTNSDSVFIAPFGRCGGINGTTFVNMSEVVTAATMASVHQYMNPSTSPIESSIGADGIYTSDLALSKSFDNVSNMVDLSTGLARSSSTHTTAGLGVSGVTLTVTPDQAKLNHVADILSSCINNASSGSAACTTLYANTVPVSDPSTTSTPNATTPAATDVLMAAYYLFTNPTAGSSTRLANLYNIPAATGSPYMPRLTSQPTDWTISMDYTSTGNCSDVSTPSANYLNRPVGLAIDGNGSIWFANNQSGAGSLAAFGPTGLPLSCLTLPAGTNNTGSSTSAGAQSTVVDSQGNIWVGSTRSSDVYRYAYTVNGTATTVSTATAAPVTAMTADGYGDVFFATNSGDLYEIVNGARASTLPSPVKINTISLGSPAKIMIDSDNRIWAGSQSNFVTATTGSVQSTTPASLGGFTTTQYPLAGGIYGVASTRAYNPAQAFGPGAYFSAFTGGSASLLLSTGNVSGSSFSGGGLSHPADVSLDGAQNLWVANQSGSGPSEFSKGGTALSPASGFTLQNTANGQRSIVVDVSGNVWLGREGASTITELVGAAVPVVQPYSSGLPGAQGPGRFQNLP